MFPLLETHHLLTVDPSLGRLDYESLSDQALMEMLIEGLKSEQKAMYKDANGNFHDVCEWRGMSCIDNSVTFVSFNNLDFGSKQFPFDFIPPSAVTFIATLCGSHGTLDTSLLPTSLTTLNVQHNDLEGTIRWKGLPRKLRMLYINGNSFQGKIILCDLPPSLISLDASMNSFCGEIALSDLPVAMTNINVVSNELEGPITIESLPSRLRILDLRENLFSGDFTILDAPSGLESVDIGGNDISGTIVLPVYAGEMEFILFSDNIEAIVDEREDPHPWEEKIRTDNGERII